MIFTMVVTLFTSRVVLDVLGVENYGIYNVVAGFVSMFSFFTTSLSAAISRFLTYELGKGNQENLKNIFSTSVNVQLLLSLFVLLLAETAGLWFLNYKLNIPAERLYAANWVFQFAILSFIFNLISVPYNASIIAHEKMSAFAYISILEVTLKLVIVYMICISPFDKLISYSFLFALVALAIRVVYSMYCTRHFAECRHQFVMDRKLLSEMTGFAGWNLLGSGAYLFNTQGVNIITNLYFGVAFNAARGVATQVEGAIRMFVNSFTTALNPQITKSYAEGNMDYLYTLVCRGAKYSYLLMLFFAIPFIFESDTILQLWLKEVPEHTSLFFRLSVLGTLFDVLGNSTAMACWATGKVKRYYIIVGTLGAMVFFISWLLFALGCPAYSSYLVFIVIYCVLVFVKARIIKGLMGFPMNMFLRQTIGRVVPVTLLCFAVTFIPWWACSDVLLRLVAVGLTSTISMLLFVYLFGLEKTEKQMVSRKLTELRNKGL
jgi:O-antigen/teichoic acid export membrane protein